MSSTISSSLPTADLLSAKFRDLFNADPLVVRAPGRINIIGEHTDYNEGFVMPMAIGLYTWVGAARRTDRVLETYSKHFDEKIALSLDNLAGPPRNHWSDFVRGVAATLQQAGYSLPGVNLAIFGDIPLGAGLSSSASLEVALALALTSVTEIDVPRLDLVKFCQSAEHQYVGTRCGIMDQFTAGFGVAGSALMLDCRSLDYQILAVPPALRVVVCNSMVRHDLASGEYNRRREECEIGVNILQTFVPTARALRDISITDLDKHKSALPPHVYRRCRHVISENSRVIAATDVLKSGDLVRLGDLLYRSHSSLRDDYEVSCRELDLLVVLASLRRGIYGARMMGGGFGGCTVNLLQSDHVNSFQSEIAQLYEERTGIAPEIYVFEPA